LFQRSSETVCSTRAGNISLRTTGKAGSTLQTFQRIECAVSEKEGETARETFQKAFREAFPQRRQSRAETEQRQRQQQSRNGLAAAAQNEEHKSSFSLANVRRYVDAVKRHATNPGGLARVLWRSGEEDTDIGNRLEREQMRAGALVGPNDDFSDFGMDDYIAHLIERRDITELKKEREGIHDRGGPIDPWERRVCDYLNQHAANEAASIEGGRQ
jgi:hypothetical protein